MTTTTLRAPLRFRTEPQTSSASHIWILFKLWYDRVHQRHQLSQLNPEQLEDIGVTRCQAIEEAATPFWK